MNIFEKQNEITEYIEDMLDTISRVITDRLSEGTKESCLMAAKDLYSLVRTYAGEKNSTDVSDQFLFKTGIDLNDHTAETER